MTTEQDGQSVLRHGRPGRHGLYDPAFEKDSCGVGFIAHIKGLKSHAIVRDALVMLQHMSHRGACGCEVNTGDGAGILTALPHTFLDRVAQRDAGLTLPPQGEYGAGIVFLPREEEPRALCKQTIAEIVASEGLRQIGWRKVPQDNTTVGETARKTEPHMEMLFVAFPDDMGDPAALERKLMVVRKQATHRLRGGRLLPVPEAFYICSLSTRILIYKGQLTSEQIPEYFADLREPDYESHLAMVHSRFSTNTFPSWDRAHPFRAMCHNGEINTLRGNVNWLHAREGMMRSTAFGRDLAKLMPVIEPDLSDSGTFDNCLELLLQAGRPLPEAVMMMIPEAWENHPAMSRAKQSFYEYSACKMEPWDGPASIVFTDGTSIGAVLDRNGLRPSRYYLTRDNLVIMSSEVGVLPVAPENVAAKGRLEPGRIFLVDFTQGRIVPDEEVKQAVADRHPYDQWLQTHRLKLSDLPVPHVPPAFGSEQDLLARMRALGFTTETLQFMLLPMVETKKDPIGSMGNDAALACLSDKPRLIYDYFKQLFAQVTNPPIDSIREEVIMSIECYVGPEGNLLESRPEDCHRLLIAHPILTEAQTESLKSMNYKGWKTRTIDITCDRTALETWKGRALAEALDRICREASDAIGDGYSLIVLSDRGLGPRRVAISALLAAGTVHHHLVRKTERTKIGIIVETGEAREVHHFCLLLGYGADAITPYLAYEALGHVLAESQGEHMTPHHIVDDYRKSAAKGILKVMAKMGISTLQSYKGAQIFEALGLASEVVDRCFVGTPSRIQGCGFDVLAEESLRRHELGYPQRPEARMPLLPNDGQFHWRAEGERHAWRPETIAQLQVAARTNSRQAYEDFARMCDDNARQSYALRGLLRFKPLPSGPVPLEEVEPAAAIVKRFVTGAMSFGSISAEAHETLAIAMNRVGGKSNTGEGGEDSVRFQRLPNGDSKRSAIKQIASGRFGVTIWYLANADELQIKMAQGAKPGEGGELPGHKVDETIARIRHSTPGVGLISPPPHHDIYSIEDLKQLIHDLKNANPSARISVKLVSEVGVGTIAAGVAKGYADHILVSGDVGGTGASPLTSIKHAGLPWELGIAETHQTLVLNDLRSRVVLQTDGGIKTGRDVVIAALLGAEEMGFSTAPLITLGCIMMRKCHLNTCPVGVATQDPELRKRFAGKPEHLINYLFMVAEHARRVMAELGFRRIDDLIGRTDCLVADDAIRHWKSDGLDLTPILAAPLKLKPGVEVRCTRKQDHGLDEALDHTLIRLAQPALTAGGRVEIELPISNTNRTVGTMLSHEVAKRWGEDGLPPGSIRIRFTGSAGQSFAAFLARGIAIELEGDANDYVGKGLSGGRLVIVPPKASPFAPEKNIIIGNVALYGATSGQAFFRGMAAERFCVRNSGATACVEGVGDHGCEYMTGGRAVILGPTGRNFAAGMSGGIAYVWDPQRQLKDHCNLLTVDLEKVEASKDVSELRSIVEQHHGYTKSSVAAHVLANWREVLPQFVKVMPQDYKRVLTERMKRDEEKDATVHEVQVVAEVPHG